MKGNERQGKNLITLPGENAGCPVPGRGIHHSGDMLKKQENTSMTPKNTIAPLFGERS
jgi:hypothetical protein